MEAMACGAFTASAVGSIGLAWEGVIRKDRRAAQPGCLVRCLPGVSPQPCVVTVPGSFT